MKTNRLNLHLAKMTIVTAALLLFTTQSILGQNRVKRNDDPSSGDNLNSKAEIAGIYISESISPLIDVPLISTDGVDLSFAYRKPPGDGPFPTILFFHGGGKMGNIKYLKNNLKDAPIHTRFLRAGFMIATSTRRPYWPNEGTIEQTGFYEAVADATLIVEKVKSIPGASPENVILYGGSGGGILAIATAAKTELACVIAGEPASVIPLDPRTGMATPLSNYQKVMNDPFHYYIGEIKSEIRGWLSSISCPILILQGDQFGLFKVNNELLVPELKSLGKSITTITFPGMRHGFYWGIIKTGVTTEILEKVVEDSIEFIDTHTSINSKTH